jgi:hypothetical protein
MQLIFLKSPSPRHVDFLPQCFQCAANHAQRKSLPLQQLHQPQLVLLMHLAVDEQFHSTSSNFAECRASSK